MLEEGVYERGRKGGGGAYCQSPIVGERFLEHC